MRERLDRSEIESQSDLMAALGSLENLSLKFSDKEKAGKQGDRKPSVRKYKPCTFCEKLGKQGLFHPEVKCWNNPESPDYKLNQRSTFSSKTLGNKPIKVVNNVELQDVINEIVPNQKNLS